MKKYGSIVSGIVVLVFLLFFPLALLAEEGKMHEKMGHEAKKVQASAKNGVMDPVCGMLIKPEDAAGKSDYKGKTYYFCMDADKKAFDKDPDKYIAQMAQKKPSNPMHKGDGAMEGHHQKVHEGQWMAPEKEAKRPNPVKPTEEALKAAAETFKERCALCHGETGRGDGALAQNLDPKPRDLGGEITRNHPDGDLFYKISEGKNSMPAWGMVLSEEARWGLVNYIRSLSKKKPEDKE